MKFKARAGNPRIWHRSLKGPIVFVDGQYETTDEREIAELSRDRRVLPVDENLDKLTRDQLNTKAESLGIDPKSLKTKGDVIEEIKRAS